MSATQESVKRGRGRPALPPEEKARRRKLRKYSNKNPAPARVENKKLTRKEELFVRELVSKDGQITLQEAAINAGYPPASARTRAYEMTNPNICPNVVKAIKEFRKEVDEKYGITYHRHVRDMQTIRDKAMEAGAWSAAVQAEYRRGQAHGDIYINKSEIRHGSIDQMSKEEVLAALKELKGSHEQSEYGVGAMADFEEEAEKNTSDSDSDQT